MNRLRRVQAFIAALGTAAPTAACVDFGRSIDHQHSLAISDAAEETGGDVGAVDAGAADAGAIDAAVRCVEGAVALASVPRGSLEIRIGSFTLDRPAATVRSGSVVVWANDDEMVHRLVSGAPDAPVPPSRGGFDTGDLAAGRRYAHRFCSPRALVYFCETHPRLMNGFRLVVE